MILAEGGPPSRELSGQEVQANPAGRQTGSSRPGPRPCSKALVLPKGLGKEVPGQVQATLSWRSCRCWARAQDVVCLKGAIWTTGAEVQFRFEFGARPQVTSKLAGHSSLSGQGGDTLGSCRTTLIV